MPEPSVLRRILVVEDNPTDVQLIAEALHANGVVHELVVLEDGDKALRHFSACENAKPDLIILDLHVPKHDGLEVLTEYRRTVRLGAVPIVVLTSSDSPSERRRAEMIGVSAFLQKPMTLDAFLAIGKRLKAFLETSAAT
jgi:chemotaxis family two-component system response regulator Rcp1